MNDAVTMGFCAGTIGHVRTDTRERDARGQRFRALRKLAGLSQEAVADRGQLRREQISDVERGKNQGTSARILSGLAGGVGISPEAMSLVLSGRISPERALSEIRDPASVAVDCGMRPANSRGEPMDPKWEALVDLVEVDGEPVDRAYALIRAIEGEPGLVTASDFYHVARKHRPNLEAISGKSARSMIGELAHDQVKHPPGDGGGTRKKRN
jgi:transcriptional regulator with XRE-family HTH domain